MLLINVLEPGLYACMVCEEVWYCCKVDLGIRVIVTEQVSGRDVTITRIFAVSIRLFVSPEIAGSRFTPLLIRYSNDSSINIVNLHKT